MYQTKRISIAVLLILCSLLTLPVHSDVNVELNLKAKVSGTIEPSGEVETYRFEATTVTLLSFTLVAKKGANLDFQVSLTDPGSNVLDLTLFPFYVDQDRKIALKKYPLLDTGTYELAITATGTGEYALKMKGQPQKKFVVTQNVPAMSNIMVGFSGPFASRATLKAKASKGSLAEPRFGNVDGQDLTLLGKISTKSHSVKLDSVSGGDMNAQLNNLSPTGGDIDLKIGVKPPKVKTQKLDLRAATLGSPTGGETASGKIVEAVNGGTVTVTDGGDLDGAAVAVPAGALIVDTGILISSTDAATPPQPATQQAAGPTVRFTPTAMTFLSVATVTIPYDIAMLPAGTDPLTDLQILRVDADGTTSLVAPTSVDQGNTQLTLEVSTLATFVPIAPRGVGTWSQITPPGSLSARAAAVTHWTGTHLLVYGGEDATSSTNTGALYDPVGDGWTPISTTGAPAHRTDLFNFRESFTGGVNGRLLIWGGRSSSGPYFDGGSIFQPVYDGAIYDLGTDTWTAMAAIPGGAAYAGRAYLHGVWTGSELLVWAGNNEADDAGSSYSYLETDPAYGSIFNPGADWTSAADDTWSTMTTTGAPLQRKHGVAVWTGGTDNRMLVWGGAYGDPETAWYSDGYLYDPVGDTWTPISTTGAPTGRKFAFYAWTGTQLIVWGGFGPGNTAVADGAIYDLAGNSWTPITATNAPTGRAETKRGIWTGSHFIVWGGMTFDGMNFAFKDDGAIYDHLTDTWTSIPATAFLPTPVGKSQIVWTGTQVIIWSGWSGGTTYDSAGAVLTLDPQYYP